MLKVLVVDDQAVNRLLPTTLLKQKGCGVMETDSAEAALEILEQREFDCILLDISMPGMSGIELCQLLRARESTRRTRIVAYTAHAMPEERTDILNAGFDDLLIKPISRNELYAVVGLLA